MVFRVQGDDDYGGGGGNLEINTMFALDHAAALAGAASSSGGRFSRPRFREVITAWGLLFFPPPPPFPFPSILPWSD